MKLKFSRLVTILILIAFALSLTACSSEPEAAADKIILLLDWTPNTNYSGIYAALDKGYYDQENLDLEIVEAPGSVVQMVASGQAHFGFSYQEQVTYARVSDIPVVSVAAVIQNNTSGFASLKEREITTPADFSGKTYGGWGSPEEEATIEALMSHYDADYQSVEIITTGEIDPLMVIEREADFAWIYYGWTGIQAELKGLSLNFIELRLEEPALDYYTPVIISSESLIAENPDLVERFMRATAKGYTLAIAEPAQAAASLIKYAPELDQELVLASQNWLSERYQGSAETWGWQEATIWHNYGQWLFDYGLIEKVPDLDQAYTNQFLR